MHELVMDLFFVMAVHSMLGPQMIQNAAEQSVFNEQREFTSASVVCLVTVFELQMDQILNA